MKLVQVAIPKSLFWPLKIFFCIAAAYVFYRIMIDVRDGFIIRRGIEYSLESEPRSFYINIVMRFGIFALLVWFGTSGTYKKEVSSNGN
ncbi:hypothetical protein [Alteromonas sp. CYL-A6]|uniref:hypothetical protein n=1 Tax=Alteromonas nitratireducens TaxID=3390813 RepID=UPI0034ADC84D